MRGITRHLTLAVAGALGVAACGLNFDRYDPGATDPLDGGLDVTAADVTPTDAATRDAPSTDASPEDSPAAVDVVEDAPNPCPPTAGVIPAPQIAGTITIDGDLGDWGSPAFTALDASNAQLILGPSGACTAATATTQCLVPAGENTQFALLRDATNVYLAVRVAVPSVGGTNTMTPYLNDALEIYFRGDPVAIGDYTNIDHQYIIDWQNLVLDYGPPSASSPIMNPPGVTSAVKVAPSNDGWVLEMQMALSEMGRASLTSGQTFGFDLAVDHGQGTTATRSFVTWWMEPHSPPTCMTAKCMSCTPEQPYCDTLNFGLACAD